MEQTECSETLSYKIQKPGNYPEESLIRLWRWNSVPKRRHIKFRRLGITQKKAYNIQNTAKVWNQDDFSSNFLCSSRFTFRPKRFTSCTCQYDILNSQHERHCEGRLPFHTRNNSTLLCCNTGHNVLCNISSSLKASIYTFFQFNSFVFSNNNKLLCTIS